ncbi:hypothetical protein HPB49_017684 [Dermacentor silvarum]|uniref:Uncharacterized protein n=1 Tax=Dermacentor silvarum TaxID=543639 RepID=A0ACB8DEK7_DERSI|nr:hypothetical protein HPB49_017684 [Dermacentor silvarum]
MPRLPRDDINIIVLPKDGLNIRNTCGTSLGEVIRKEAVAGDDKMCTICPNPMQNILVISTPDETTATKISKIKQMVKGIIRNIPLKYTLGQLVYVLVNSRNPSLTYAKRASRQLGHRPDVCPRVEIKLYRTCGSKNPSSEHECTPKCRMYGEAHPPAGRMCKAKYNLPHILKQRRWRARSRAERERTLEDGKTTPQRTPSPSGCSMAEGKGQKQKSKPKSEWKPQPEPKPPPARRHADHIRRDTDRAAQSHLVRHSRGKKWILCREHPVTGSTKGAPYALLAARMKKMERENKELREALGRTRKQNEQSARKIDELQQSLNAILKSMTGCSHERISSSISRKAAEPGDATATGGEVGQMDMCCGEEEALATAGSKRKGTSDAPPREDAVDHAQAPKRPRSGAGKVAAIEEMVNKLTDKTERMFDILLTRQNQSDAGRNAQYAAVNTQLAAMHKRIEDLERGTMQLQQQHNHHHQPGMAGVPSPQAINVPSILTSGNNADTTRTRAGGTHGQFCPTNTSA